MFYFFGKSVRKVRAFGSRQIIAEVTLNGGLVRAFPKIPFIQV